MYTSQWGPTSNPSSFFFFFLLKRENEIQGLFGGEVEEGQRRSKDAWKFEPSVG